MKKLYVLLFFFATASYAQTPCINGYAGIYPCSGFGLQSQIPFTSMDATNSSDSWGWVDPLDNKEYAIIGLDNGTGFIDISDPVNPVYLGKLPSATGTALARDIKTYNNFAFVVSDGNGAHGMQVFDLTRLRSVVNPPVTFTMDAHYTDFENAHNLAINEDTGYAYALRTNTYGGGIHFIDIQDPMNPVAAGGFSGVYTHDAQIVNYNGPDSDYTGREILFSFNGYDQDVWIVDITDKANPQAITNFTFTSSEHSHQGWLTEDHKFMIMGDEADELNFGFNTRTIIFDLTDLDNPIQSFEHTGSTTATDHNGYTMGDNYYLANYAAGLRVFDISDIENGTMVETGHFDVYPTNNAAGFNGAWTAYPYFPSGNILVSALTYTDPNYTGGFFLLKDGLLGTNDFDQTNGISLLPNPATDSVEITFQNDLILESIEVFDVTGRRIKVETTNTVDISSFQNGLLFVRIFTDQGITTKKLLKK